MKIILLTVSFPFLLMSATPSSDYCDGWEDGYEQGWCYERYACISPITPICPIPRYYESNSSYTDGYNRGFETALKNRR